MSAAALREGSPIALAAAAVLVLLGSALLAPLLRRRQGALVALGFGAAGAASALAAAAGFLAVHRASVERVVLPLGLPDLPFHLRLDPLAGFFLLVVGLLGAFVAVYSLGYVRGFLGRRPVTSLVVFHGLFLAGMMLVLLADDALVFLVSWEVMAASSYFLVIFEDERVENRRAAFLYLLVAHVGAVAILLAFGVMAGVAGGFGSFTGYTFDAMRGAAYPAGWATAAFFLALFGFGAKAGIVPLHVWLPEAHPVAPSNVSALMSGVMLKTAVYGLVRVVFDLLRDFPWWWGVVLLLLGLLAAVLGILAAMLERDFKRVLAYSSVKNVGMILVAVGLAMIFRSFALPLLAALALTAGLYHTLNHAMFKGLLFMGAGAVLHATGSRDLDALGGLVHRMPWTAPLTLVGCVAIAGLPPLNGFVSEWLTFQAFLLSPSLPAPLMKLLIPMGAALLALAAALAAATFVKVFGVAFLGHARTPAALAAHEAGWAMRAGMLLAAAACVGLGVLPPLVIRWMDAVPLELVGAAVGPSSWMWLNPIAAERASYSAPALFFGVLGVILAAYVLLHVRPGAIRRGAIWDCGFAKLTPRMQYTAASFAMPSRRIFGFLFQVRERARVLPYPGQAAYARRIGYRLRVRDRFRGWLYAPVGAAALWLARQSGRLQQGRIQAYLISSFLTIIVLLVFLR